MDDWYPGKPLSREEVLEREIARLRRLLAQRDEEALLRSWELNPDRMGGQFTQQEIEDSRRGGPSGWY